MNKEKDQSCWLCVYRRDLGDTFLGICTWFEQNGKGENKPIPALTVDIGCKHWLSEKSRH